MINRSVLVAGVVLVVANGAILVNVARNHAGNPDAVVRLSEREAHSFMSPEKETEMMLVLRLEWQMALGPDGADTWFDTARLEALGYNDLPAATDSMTGRNWLGREKQGYAVLELAGPAWEKWEAAQQAQRDSLGGAPPVEPVPHHGGPAPRGSWNVRGSRLMAVDVGLDPMALRGQYPDRSRYLILPAKFRPDFIPSMRDSAGAVKEPARITGRISQILPGTLVVPMPLRDSLLGLGAGAPDSTTHYELTIKVGKRWEAWVE